MRSGRKSFPFRLRTMAPMKVPYHFTDKKNGYVDGIFHGIVEGCPHLFVINERVSTGDPCGPIPVGFVRGSTAYGHGKMPWEFRHARYGNTTANWLTFLHKTADERGEDWEFWSKNVIYTILGHVIPDPDVLSWGWKDTISDDYSDSKKLACQSI